MCEYSLQHFIALSTQIADAVSAGRSENFWCLSSKTQLSAPPAPSSPTTSPLQAQQLWDLRSVLGAAVISSNVFKAGGPGLSKDLEWAFNIQNIPKWAEITT